MLSKYLSPKSDKPKEPTSAVSAIDKKVLSDLALALGEDGVNELVKIYIQTLDDHIQSISTHLKNGAMEDASRAAHTLKSSTLSLGGVVLGDLCQQIEQFTEDDQEKGLGVLPKLSNYADQFKEALFEIYPKLRVD